MKLTKYIFTYYPSIHCVKIYASYMWKYQNTYLATRNMNTLFDVHFLYLWFFGAIFYWWEHITRTFSNGIYFPGLIYYTLFISVIRIIKDNIILPFPFSIYCFYFHIKSCFSIKRTFKCYLELEMKAEMWFYQLNKRIC